MAGQTYRLNELSGVLESTSELVVVASLSVPAMTLPTSKARVEIRIVNFISFCLVFFLAEEILDNVLCDGLNHALSVYGSLKYLTFSQTTNRRP